MSQENVEIVRAIYERWSKGDFRASFDLLDPQVVLVLGPEFADGGIYSGAEAVSAYTRNVLLEPWTRFTIEAEEIVSAGDTVLAGVCQRGVGSASGVPGGDALLHPLVLSWTQGDSHRELSGGVPKPSKPPGCRSRRCRRRTSEACQLGASRASVQITRP